MCQLFDGNPYPRIPTGSSPSVLHQRLSSLIKERSGDTAFFHLRTSYGKLLPVTRWVAQTLTVFLPELGQDDSSLQPWFRFHVLDKPFNALVFSCTIACFRNTRPWRMSDFPSRDFFGSRYMRTEIWRHHNGDANNRRNKTGYYG